MIRVAVKLFLLFLLVYAGVNFGYGRLEKRLRIAPVAVATRTAPAQPAEKAAQVLQKTRNYQIILTRNIFEAVLEQKNVEPKEKKPEQVVEKEPEETTLKLVLHGTVTGSDRDARAIIVDQKNKKQDLYQIGDAVQGALITSIERGKVILEVNGKKQLLVLKDREGGGGAPSNRSRSSGPVFVPKKPVFAKPPSRSVFSKKSGTAPPRAVPHRRISFRQDTGEDVHPDSEILEHEEPEGPLLDEDLEQIPEEPGARALGTEIIQE